MNKKLEMLNEYNEVVNVEIDLNDVLCFESELDDTFTLFSKNKDHDGLIYKGTTYDLAEELLNDKIEFMSEYITELTYYIDNEEYKEAAVLKVIIYNPNNALISFDYVEENKYDASLIFLDDNKTIKCKYETYWSDEDVSWYQNFKNEHKMN